MDNFAIDSLHYLKHLIIILIKIVLNNDCLFFINSAIIFTWSVGEAVNTLGSHPSIHGFEPRTGYQIKITPT